MTHFIAEVSSNHHRDLTRCFSGKSGRKELLLLVERVAMPLRYVTVDGFDSELLLFRRR